MYLCKMVLRRRKLKEENLDGHISKLLNLENKWLEKIKNKIKIMFLNNTSICLWMIGEEYFCCHFINSIA